MLITLQEAITRWQWLRDEIARHDIRYFQQDDPSISDEAYDALRRELQALEVHYPQLAQQAILGPSERVGVPVAATLESIIHLKPLLSLDNAFSLDEVKTFFAKANRFLGMSSDVFHPFWAEPKVDGLSIALRYYRGILVSAATRGDGFRGENITKNLKLIPSIPRVLLGGKSPEVCEVRGEAFMRRQDFTTLNQQRQSLGLKAFATARNSASGSLRHIHQQDIIAPLYFYPHDVFIPDKKLESYTQVRSTLQVWGFDVMPQARLCSHWDHVDKVYVWFVAHRDTLAYEIDGIVYKLDDVGLQERLGFSARAPRFAVAQKLGTQEVSTLLQHIAIQVGRTGVLTPVAWLKPVSLGGVIVSRASLHNYDDIVRKGLRVGQQVRVRRAGDVIPYVVGPSEEAPYPEGETFIMPNKCPVCHYPTLQEGAVMRCTGGMMCQDQALWRLRHGFSRSGLDIRGLGPENCKFFYEKGWIRQLADAFTLEKRGILTLLETSPGWGKVSCQRLWSAIQAAKTCRLSSFIYALGILGVGETSATLLAQVYRTVETLMQDFKSLAEGRGTLLEGVGKVGPCLEESLKEFSRSADVMAMVVALQHELHIMPYSQSDLGDYKPLQGKSLIVTGKLITMTRAEAKQWAQTMGAQVHSQLNKSTTMVIVGKSPTAQKIEDAHARNLTCLSEDVWCEWVERFKQKTL